MNRASPVFTLESELVENWSKEMCKTAIRLNEGANILRMVEILND